LQTYLRQFRKEGSPGTAGSGPSDRDAREVAGLAFEHYYDSATLLGTPGKCARLVEALAACGVGEVACLVDFGLATETVLAALPRLAEIARHFSDDGKGTEREARSRNTMRDGVSASA